MWTAEFGMKTTVRRSAIPNPNSAFKWSLGKVLPLRFLGVGQT